MSLTSRLFFLFVIILISGCQNQITPENCLEWYTKAFKGHPPSAHKYQENCKTPHLEAKLDCQKAFNQLLMGATEPQLKKQFGDYVMNCFNEREREKHLKK